VNVDRSAIIGSGGNSWAAIETAMDRTTLLLCAYMLGGAQRVADMAIEYSKSRTAFGVPIGTFQRVQDLVVAALNDADAMRWATYEALWKMDETKEDARTAVSMAKAIASEAFPRACENSHYVHAGVAMDLDYGLTHHTKRSRFYSLYLGDANHHKLRMARLLGL
jgi:alkylation response protein AidB-like acyl-CoA dehydrogenase